MSSSEIGHLHCSNSSSAVAIVIVSELPGKQALLDLPTLLATDATFAFEMTAAATLGLCSGCLLCLLPIWFLPLAIKFRPVRLPPSLKGT